MILLLQRCCGCGCLLTIATGVLVLVLVLQVDWNPPWAVNGDTPFSNRTRMEAVKTKWWWSFVVGISFYDDKDQLRLVLIMRWNYVVAINSGIGWLLSSIEAKGVRRIRRQEIKNRRHSVKFCVGLKSILWDGFMHSGIQPTNQKGGAWISKSLPHILQFFSRVWKYPYNKDLGRK